MESDREQRTEEATPRKKEKLREEGKVPQSADVGSVAGLVAVVLTLGFIGEDAVINVVDFATRIFTLRDVGNPLSAVSATVPVIRTAVVPLIAVASIVGLSAGVIQTRGLFSLKLLAPKPERIDPIPKLKTVLPSKESLAEVAKQLLKVTAIGAVVYELVSDAITDFVVLPSSPPAVAAATVGQVVRRLCLYGGGAFAVVAAIDYWHARRKFAEENKMSKQDVKDEHNEMEGRPEVKRKRFQKMAELGRQRAVTDVHNATVLVCNPTHIAVGLRYELDRDPAPVMLCKGVDGVALRMRTEARKHRVPIVENRPLARALHQTGKLGRPIPVGLYQAAAGVIAHVMNLRGGAA